MPNDNFHIDEVVAKLHDTMEARICVIFGWVVVISNYPIFSIVIMSLFEF